MQLHSEWAHFDGGGESRRLLLALPLPGAWSGTQHFLVYVRLPIDDSSVQIGDAFGRESVSGFLIQTRGDAAGLTEFVSGKIDIKGVAFGGTNWCQGTMDLRTDDATEIRGWFRARRDRERLRRFEFEEHAGDVQALFAPQPVEAQEEAAER